MTGKIDLEYVKSNCRFYESNQAIYYHGMHIGVCHTADEIEAVQKALLKAELSDDTWNQILKIKNQIYNGNAECLVEKFKEVRYNSSAGLNCIVDTEGKVVFDLISYEILDLCSDLKRGKTLDDLVHNYLENDAFSFYHGNTFTEEHLALFVEYWSRGMLNRVLGFICNYSNSEDGLIDWGTGFITRNKRLRDYIFEAEDFE